MILNNESQMYDKLFNLITVLFDFFSFLQHDDKRKTAAAGPDLITFDEFDQLSGRVDKVKLARKCLATLRDSNINFPL